MAETDVHLTKSGMEKLVKPEQETRLDTNNNAETVPQSEFKAEIVWKNVGLFIILHMSIPYLIYFLFTHDNWGRMGWLHLFLGIMSGVGVTGGAHRLWSHRAYKAKLPMRIFLAFFFIMAGQNDILEWCRDHRVHHKYTETDADPHNSRRGFFFAHMGWLCCRKHPDVIAKGQQIDCSDIWADPVVRFQRRWYKPLWVVCVWMVPTAIGLWLGEELIPAVVMNAVRYCLLLHGTWLVNSAAHFYGDRPYNSKIEPRESGVVISLLLGEGYHNYHHTYPQDYRASEFGWNMQLNLTALIIDLFAAMGLAYDLKRPSKEVVEAAKKRTTMGKDQAPELLSY